MMFGWFICRIIINLFHGFKKLYFVMKNLVKKLIQKKLKISFAESCTGGMLASSITSISGASKVFQSWIYHLLQSSKNKCFKN